MFQEDFGDAPSVEELAPDVTLDELAQLAGLLPYPCDHCGRELPFNELIATGLEEFYTMDLDPETVLCCDCYEEERQAHIPSDPSLFDCYTPVEITQVW